MLYGRQYQGQPRAFARGGLSPRARLMRLRIVVWLLGLGGFSAFLIAGRFLPHPDSWRAAAIIWFLAAGAIYGGLALRRP